MRRGVVVLATGVLLLALGTGPASADSGCPPEASGFVEYPIVGSVGDPAPEPGVEPLWDLLVADAAAEGLTIEELAASIGLTVDELYTFVLQGWFGWDKNADRNICVQKFPEQGGIPAYLWNVIDNNAKVRG